MQRNRTPSVVMTATSTSLTRDLKPQWLPRVQTHAPVTTASPPPFPPPSAPPVLNE